MQNASHSLLANSLLTPLPYSRPNDSVTTADHGCEDMQNVHGLQQAANHVKEALRHANSCSQLFTTALQ